MRKLRTAADAGNAGAQFNLGVMLHDRPDAKDQPAGQNRAEAIGWLLKAALQGLPRAQIKLAEVYANPPASRDEQVRACTWFLVAATSATGIHLHRAQTGYARLVERLSPDQVTMATQDADSTIEELRRCAAAPPRRRRNEGHRAMPWCAVCGTAAGPVAIGAAADYVLQVSIF